MLIRTAEDKAKSKYLEAKGRISEDCPPHAWEDIEEREDCKIVKCMKCGLERKVSVSDKEKDMIKRGDMLQSVGPDRDKFLETYGFLPDAEVKDTNKYISRHGIRPKRPRDDKTIEEIQGQQ